VKNQLIIFASDDGGNHWKWQYQMAEAIAHKVDKEALGVKVDT